MPSEEIEQAIAEFTGVSGEADGRTVWVYGQMVKALRPAFEFIVSRGITTKRVTILADQVKRYRDGESHLFLIEMPATMAIVLDICEMILTDEELHRLKRNIDTRMTW